jgi:hypothetical protein
MLFAIICVLLAILYFHAPTWLIRLIGVLLVLLIIREVQTPEFDYSDKEKDKTVFDDWMNW